MRSRDRLEELRRAAAPGGDDSALLPPAAPGAGGAGAPGAGGAGAPGDQEIEELLHEASAARGWVHEIARNTQLARRLHADPTYHTNRQLQQQLDAAVTQSHAAGLKVCGALRQLEARAASPAGELRARLARLQAACTRRLYADALAEQHGALQLLRDDQRSLLRKHVQLTNLTLSDEECESLLDTDNIALFVDNVRAQTADARRALRDVEVRHEELARVEGSLSALRDLFAQLAHLVALQQEQVDTVEYYARAAGARVQGGQHELLKGAVSRRGARSKKLSLIICLVTGFTVVMLVLILT